MKRIAAAVLLTVVGMASSTAEAGGTIVVSGGAEVRPGGPQPIPPPRRYRRTPGPRLMAPLKIDMGFIAGSSEYGTMTGGELSVGIHWASLSPEPTPYDFGIGVFVGGMATVDEPPPAIEDDSVVYAGGYAEFGRTLSGGDFWRTWASGRAEYLSSQAFDNDDRQGLGFSAKLEAELYLSGVGATLDGLFFGTYAIGVYVEAGVRQLGPDVGRGQLGLGLTFRTPLVLRL